MSQPIKLPVFIGIVTAAVLILGLIGYKFVVASSPPPRTDAAAQELIASYAKGRAQKQAGSPAMQTSQKH